jgi:hypothetical protein
MSFAPKKSFSLPSPFSSSPLPLFLVSSAPFFFRQDVKEKVKQKKSLKEI